MKIYSINTRMPYVEFLHEVSSENDKKVRRFRLGHLLFTVQLHSWEVKDFDKKSNYQKEELLKEKLPKKIRESLKNAVHDYDSKLTKDLEAEADKIHAQREKLQQMADDARAARAEIEAAEAAKEAAEAAKEADEAKAEAEAKALDEHIAAMLVGYGLIKKPETPPPAEGQQTAEEAAKAKTAEKKKLSDAVDAAKAEVDKLKAKLNDEKLTGAARDSVNDKYRKALEAYFDASGKLASFISSTI